jgi:hypothetical protein
MGCHVRPRSAKIELSRGGAPRRDGELEVCVAPDNENNDDVDAPADRFANPDRQPGLPLTVALLTVGTVVRGWQRCVRPVIRGAGHVVSMPFALLSWRDTDHRSPVDTAEKLRRDLAGLSGATRDDVRALLAGTTEDLERRRQFGPRIPPRAYELTAVNGMPTVRRVRIGGNYRTTAQWLHRDAMGTPGRLAAAVVQATGETVSRSGSREVLLSILVRHTVEPRPFTANLVCRTRGSVVRQLSFSEDYRAALTPTTSTPE